MQDLKVIGVENGSLLAASEEGDRFRIAIDEVLQSRLRQPQAESSTAAKLSPREIQAHIRAGMSAEDVADVTGAAIDYVRRFEGAVLAEREYILSSALGVPVHTAIDPEPVDDRSNFGSVIRERLASLGASDERWASWKEPGGGWIVKLSFTADEIDHDARWSFEPKKNALSPLGNEAVALSQQGELKGSLIPRLRAVGGEANAADATRFDSGAFNFKESLPDEILNDTAPHLEPIPYSRVMSATDAVSKAAIKRADEPPTGLSETADLLEALRRRRGEREAAVFEDQEATAKQPSVASMRLVDVPLSTFDDAESEDTTQNAWANQAARAQSRGNTGDRGERGSSRNSGSSSSTGNHGRRGRASMPSWDEIVFGARTDDDLA